MPTVKVQKKGQVTLPSAVRERVGIADGDLLEVKLHRGTVVLTPKHFVDRSVFPAADDEYTPAQRRTIDGQIAEGLEDVRRGRVHGPFKTHKEMMRFLNKDLKKKGTSKSNRKTK